MPVELSKPAFVKPRARVVKPESEPTRVLSHSISAVTARLLGDFMGKNDCGDVARSVVGLRVWRIDPESSMLSVIGRPVPMIVPYAQLASI